MTPTAVAALFEALPQPKDMIGAAVERIVETQRIESESTDGEAIDRTYQQLDEALLPLDEEEAAQAWDMAYMQTTSYQ